jgi:hypothetical protein
MIDGADVLIFMSDDVFEDATERFQIPVDRSHRWQIPDIQGVHEQIRSAVEKLLRQLKNVSAT